MKFTQNNSKNVTILCKTWQLYNPILPNFNVLNLEHSSVNYPTTHDFHKIVIFIKASGFHYLNDRKIPIEPHTIHFIPQGIVHRVEKGDFFSGLCLMFKDSYFDNCAIKKSSLDELAFFKVPAKGYVCKFDREGFTKVLNVIQQIRQEYIACINHRAKQDLLCALIHLFMLECDRNKEKIDAKVHDNISNSIIEKLLITIESNYTKRLSVKDYAASLYISVSQLNRICKKTFQKTVLDLIHERVHIDAKNRLMHTQSPIKEIAWDLGFEHSSNFIAFFTHHEGLSPNQFRQICP
jgi:AraC family transcriptional regulator, transcriptional activator of pobA